MLSTKDQGYVPPDIHIVCCLMMSFFFALLSYNYLPFIKGIHGDVCQLLSCFSPSNQKKAEEKTNLKFVLPAAVRFLQQKHCSLIWSQIMVIEKCWAMPFELCVLTFPEQHLSCIDHVRCDSLGYFKGEVCWQGKLSYGVNKGKSIDAPQQQSDVGSFINGRAW